MPVTVSQRSPRFTESVIREMTRLCQQHGGVNLAQGFPDFPAPEALKDAAARAVEADVNQYAITWGAKRLRDALVAKTRALHRARLRSRDRGHGLLRLDRVHGRDAARAGESGRRGDRVRAVSTRTTARTRSCAARRPRFVRLREPDWSFDPAELERGVQRTAPRRSSSTRPTTRPARCSRRAELEQIAALCRKWDVVAVTDEIYEHILYDGAEHVSHGVARGHAGAHRDDQRASPRPTA